MSVKVQKKFAALHDAYEGARTARDYAGGIARTASLDDVAAMVLSAEGVAAVEAQLAALADERKALKRILKYARKHKAKIVPDKPAPIKIDGGKRSRSPKPAAA